MNINSLILPLITNHSGIDDKKWTTRYTISSMKGWGEATLTFSNEILLPADFSIYKDIPVRFNLKFKIFRDGSIEFYCSTVAKHNNRGEGVQKKARAVIGGYYNHLRQELKAA